MSTMTDHLRAARGVAWGALWPAFDHALVIAEECEYIADQASALGQVHVAPVYPPLVRLLADSAPRDIAAGEREGESDE